jgi:hypothetical protein
MKERASHLHTDLVAVTQFENKEEAQHNCERAGCAT